MKLRDLFGQFKAYHSHGRPIIQYTGMVGVAAFPLFYLLRFTKSAAPYDDFWLRVPAILFCAGLAAREWWPARWRAHYLPFAYVGLMYCLPFFFIFTSLANGGGVVAVANTLMVVFFLILLSDWRNTVFMLLASGGAAATLFFATFPHAQVPMDYVARLPILVLVVIGGHLFKIAQKQAEEEKLRSTYAALAASIAHEMRNPLSQVKHNLERLERSLPPAHPLYRFVSDSEVAVKRGLQLIAMTLDEVRARPVDTASLSILSAAEVVTKAVRDCAYENDEARHHVQLQVEEDFSFRGDETSYLFVLFNLLRNALYYLPRHPQMRVCIRVGAQCVRVRDTGPGIAPEALPDLFEPFRSVGKSGGTGLGLAYCRRVMRSFGGDIECESVPGRFTEFTMRFPPVSAAEQAAHESAQLDRAHAVLAGRRVLIVEDDSAQRIVSVQKLRGLDAWIDEAADGWRALELLGRQRYDLVLLDLNMPGLDGYAVAHRIRGGEVPLNREVRIVAHTSEPAEVAMAKAREAGMDGFVSKPAPRLQLLAELQHVLHQVRRPGWPTVSFAGRTVLLADDSPHNRRAVAAYLADAGAQVIEADHGEAVLERLADGARVDAVLMDLTMPGMDGIATVRAIRASGQAWSGVPVLALTARSDQGAIDAARAAGMDGVLVKPVEVDVLYESLDAVFGHRASEPAARYEVKVPASEAGAPLLNLQRLESYRRLGMLDELLGDYLPEIRRLTHLLKERADAGDLQGTLDAMHSLLGMSGEAGALALYQQVRALYVPMVEERRWPSGPWAEGVSELARRTEDVLREHAARLRQTSIT